jgi:hypothetical protein
MEADSVVVAQAHEGEQPVDPPRGPIPIHGHDDPTATGVQDHPERVGGGTGWRVPLEEGEQGGIDVRAPGLLLIGPATGGEKAAQEDRRQGREGSKSPNR